MKQYLSLSIMLSLMSGKTYSAPELAKKYETSVKTVYRSIDLLVEAGMPILSLHGKNGGYRLIKEDKSSPASFFTTRELGVFLSFLKSGSPSLVRSEFLELDERIKSIEKNSLDNRLKKDLSMFVIDTSTWGASDVDFESSKLIKEAIESQTLLEILYSTEETTRKIEPYTLVYKSGAWYLYAFCKMRQSFRLFKLSRIKKLSLTGEKFEERPVDLLSKPWNNEFKSNLECIDITLSCDEDYLGEVSQWLDGAKVIASDGKNEIICGKAYYSFGLVHRLMELNKYVKVIEPKRLQSAIISECDNISLSYQKAQNSV